MTFQAYLDTIREKTGLGVDDFRRLAAEKGLLASEVKPAQIVAWLADDYGLGRGHAMAMVAALGKAAGSGVSADAKIEAQFAGAKASWRATFDRILEVASENGAVDIAPTSSYLSLVRGGKKIAIVAVTAARLDLGLKLPGAEDGERLEASGSWNSMVTHRVRLAAPSELDDQVLGWLRQASARV